MPRANDESLLSVYAATRGFRLGHPGGFRFTPDGRELLFLRSGPRDPACALHALALDTGRERVLVRADDLLGAGGEVVPAEEAARRERMRLLHGGITSYELSADGESVLVPLSGRLFVVDRAGGCASGRSRELVPAGDAPLGPAFDPRLSPDGARAAAVRDGDVWVTELATGATRRLTRSTGAITCGLAEFVAQEEMKRLHGYWWSPDGSRIAFQRTDESMVEVLRIADPRHPERPPDERRYPRPGCANAEVTLGVACVRGDAASGGGADGGGDDAVPEPVWIEWDRERWPYLVTVRWQSGAPLTIAVQNRVQTEIAVLAADDRTGITRTLHVERDPAWVNIDQAMPLWLPDGAGLLWTTERAGAWQLELREPDGALRHAVTSPEFGLQEVVGLDPAGWVYARAAREPTVSHLWRVPLDPADGAPVPLTHAPGVHTAAISPDGRRFVHGASLPSGEELAVVRDSDGAEVARVAATAEPLPLLPRFAVVSVQGSVQAPGEAREVRQLYTGVIWPRDHRPGRKCPVIVHVYGGPHHNMVSAQPRRYLLNQWLADQGFAVVLADGRGTQHRGRAWERAIKGDLAGPALADQVAALRALAAEHPDLDLDRVGVSGWSFGGYLAAMAVLRRPDVFRAAVAGAPVVDWRDYDTHYTERYLGLPDEQPDAYRASSVLTYADRLTRPMLIIHGTVDDNVYFMHSLKLSDALLRAGAPHEFLPLSGFTHMVPGAQMIERLHERIAQFFAAHLGVARPGATR